MAHTLCLAEVLPPVIALPHTQQRSSSSFWRWHGTKWTLKQKKKRTGSLVIEMRDKGRNRGPLWRGRVLSSEAIQAVRSLKRAKGDPQKLHQTLTSDLSRLLKKDLLSVFQELQRQDLCDLLFPVFEAVRKESWYKPDLTLYAGLIETFGRNNLMDKVESCLREMQKEGLQPDSRIFTATIGAFLNMGLVESALQTFQLMKQTECYPDKLTFLVLIKGLEKLGNLELAEAVMKESIQYLQEPLDIESNKFTPTELFACYRENTCY
eukprot:TRINITY_DN5642_c0_g1_i1.p1 TRINITY_DN5642_c0_g1~~TRINITY_DN5642_c0_g1_i1.p1  ORF type:complete len:265 (-),score=49.07 TRINITY_DN5642_c0_g1_i1:900-1694(-)